MKIIIPDLFVTLLLFYISKTLELNMQSTFTAMIERYVLNLTYTFVELLDRCIFGTVIVFEVFRWLNLVIANSLLCGSLDKAYM